MSLWGKGLARADAVSSPSQIRKTAPDDKVQMLGAMTCASYFRNMNLTTTYVYDNSADARTFEQALGGPQKIIGKDGGYDPSDEHEQYSMKSGGRVQGERKWLEDMQNGANNAKISGHLLQSLAGKAGYPIRT